MREHEDYRPLMEQINQRSGGKIMLSVKEAAEAIGRSRDWIYDHIETADGYVTNVSLARQMATMQIGRKGK